MLNHFKSRAVVALLAAATSWSSLPLASGHFIWLATRSQQATDRNTESAVSTTPATTAIEVYFGESAEPDAPELLDRLDTLQVWELTRDAEPRLLETTREGDTLAAKIAGEDNATPKPALYVAHQDFGVRDKGGEKFRLMYYAKTGPTAADPVWQRIKASNAITLDVVPELIGNKIELVLTFKGAPAADCEVVIQGPGESDGKDFEGTTDEEGKYAFHAPESGRYSIRARHVEKSAGKVGDDAYDVVRHYATLTLDVPTSAIPLNATNLGDLPTTLTSFGGAVLGDFVYIYGGTKGSSHDYSSAAQNESLMRMPVVGGEWEVVAKGPRLQGLALVPHGESLYRIGGFEARNQEGEEHDLWSTDKVARFDPKTNQWTDLPSLPEPRSSFDAVVMNDHIYVVGGWAMAGEGKTKWHETAWKMDLAQDSLEWTPMAKAPFERRALALAAHDGKLFAIGGITSGGETSLESDIYDPQSDTWSRGPDLAGEDGMTGFGASAFATGGRLYVSTVAGSFQRLTPDASAWEVIAQTPTARFFHRMLPVSDSAFIVVGGSNMRGRIKAVERFEVPSL